MKKFFGQNEENQEKFHGDSRKFREKIDELENSIFYQRENAVQLVSEINTYKYLLNSLLPPNNETKIPRKKTNQTEYRDERSGFVAHIEDGIIWVRL